jgi:plasmid stability protein
MAQVLIRNLDEHVVASLKRKAEGLGLSLEAYLRERLTQASAPSRAELVTELDALRRAVTPPKPGDPLSHDMVREQRAARMANQERLRGKRP